MKEQLKTELIDLQDDIAWHNVKPSWKNSAARWHKDVKKQRMTDTMIVMNLWKRLMDLENAVRPTNMRERWLKVGGAGTGGTARAVWINETDGYDVSSVLRA